MELQVWILYFSDEVNEGDILNVKAPLENSSLMSMLSAPLF